MLEINQEQKRKSWGKKQCSVISSFFKKQIKTQNEFEDDILNLTSPQRRN